MTLRLRRAEGTARDYKGHTLSMETETGKPRRLLTLLSTAPKRGPVPLPRLKREPKPKHPAATQPHRQQPCSEDPDMT